MLYGIFGLIATLASLFGAWFAYDTHDEPLVALVCLMLAIGLFVMTLTGMRRSM